MVTIAYYLAFSFPPQIQVSTTAQTFESLLGVAGADPPDAEKMVEAYEASFEACQNSLFKPAKALGPVFSLKYVLAKGNLCCLYQEYDKFCAMLLWKRDKLDQMESLSQALGPGQAAATRHCRV